MDSALVSSITTFNSELQRTGFKVYQVGAQRNMMQLYNRKNFYKICLITGKSLIHYADRGINIDGITLFFGNPHIPYSWEVLSEYQAGYTCLFAGDFLSAGDRSESLQQSPLFKIGGTPIFHLTQEQRDFIAAIFQKMIAEQGQDYVFKNDLIRNYINLIIHEALKMQPSENFFKHKNASSRITSLFLELLERQFPIESAAQPLQLRTAQDFAQRLSIHVNHLNRSVKEITGKPTSAHISGRIITEARSLLQHTNWSIAEIAYSLGFEYPIYFHNFFKRLTGTVPTAVRG